MRCGSRSTPCGSRPASPEPGAGGRLVIHDPGGSSGVRERSSGARRRCAHHGDADLAARPRRPGGARPDPAADAVERQRAAPDRRPRGAAARPRGRVRPAGREARAPTSTARSRPRRSWPARTSRPPARSSPRTAPAPSTCSASRASSCSTPSTTAASTTGSTRRPRARLGTARAHNRGMVEFCSVDDRLLPTCYVPLVDFDEAAAMADEAIAMGAAALLVASGCPPGHSPSHLGLDPVWARAQEAGIPVVFHVGGTGDLIDPSYFRNGLPDPARLPRRRGELPLGRLHGHPGPARADARHDDLRRRARAVPRAAHRRHRAGRDLGAVVDAADGVRVRGVRTSTRSGCRPCRCARPSTCAARSGSRRTRPRTSAGSSSRPAPRSCLFSSDYPHVEGGRRPIERFEASLGDASDEVRDAFYCDNFLDLMGTAGAALAR